MQSISANLLAAAHSLNRMPFAQIIVDDPRIRGWRRSDSVSTNAFPLDARLTNNSKICRAYNDSAADPGVLHIALATVGASPTFADVSIGTINLRQDSGVALFNNPSDSSSPNRIDCFYIDNTAGTPVLKNLTSSDNGTTWGAGALSRNMMEAQVPRATSHGSQPQLACAGWDGNGGTYKPYLFYTSASAVATDPKPTLVFYDGVANTESRCWLDQISTDVLQSTVPASCIGAFQLNSTDFACVIAIENVRGTKNSGIYLVWYRDGIWSNPEPVWTYQNALDGDSTYEISHPTMQLIGSTYWILASEIYIVPGLGTDLGQSFISHLVGFASTDTIHWSAPVFLAGNDGIANGYWTSVPATPTTAYHATFTRKDMLGSKLLVSGTRTFLVGYGRLWQLDGGTPSQLSGTAADYAGQTLDLTGDITGFTISQPSGPAAQATLTLSNVASAYNNSNIVRPGARVIVKAGYKTASNDSTDLATVFTGRIDELRQQVVLGENELTLVCRDEALKRLEDWTSPNYLEYSSGQHVALTKLADYGSTIQVQGTWLLQANAGHLVAQATPLSLTGKPLLSPDLAILVANTGRIADGIFDCKFTIVGSGKGLGTGSFGVVFRYANNLNFYYLVFNNTALGPNKDTGGTKWDLLQVEENKDGKRKITSLLSAGPTAPTNTTPAKGETWWVRVHVYQNQIVCSARRDDRTQWSTICQKTTLTNNLSKSLLTSVGYFGFAAKAMSVQTKTASNMAFSNQKDGKVTSTSNAFFAQRFKTPGFPSTSVCQLTSYGVNAARKGAPTGLVSFYILQDNGSGDKPVPLASQDPALAGANAMIEPNQVNTKGWTTVNVNAAGGVTLQQDAYYWIVMAMSLGGDEADFCQWNYTFQSAEQDLGGRWDQGDGGLSWTDISSDIPNLRKFLYQASFAGPGTGVALNGYTLYSQDEPKYLDYLVKEIATKAGVLTMRPNYVLNDTGASLANFDTGGQRSGWAASGGQIVGYNTLGTQAYGYIRSTAATFHEAVVEFDMTLGAAAHEVAGGILLSQQNASTLTSNANLKCFEIEFNLDNGVVIIYALNGTAPGSVSRLFQARPLIDLQAGKQYRVKVQHSGKFLIVYLNGVVVAGVRTNQYAKTSGNTTTVETRHLHPAGYFGLVTYSDSTRNSTANFAAKFDNIVIYELKEVKDYFVIESNQNAVQALDALLKYERVKVYGDYDGALRYGYFDSLSASGDSDYTTTILKAIRYQSDREWVSHLRPFGDYHADRFSGALLDSEGLRFRQYDYTDARSDRGAYHAGAYPIRNAREGIDMLDFTAAANPGLQREDRISVQVDALGVDADYVVDDVTFRYVAGAPGIDPVFDMDVSCRKFIATSGEGAA